MKILYISIILFFACGFANAQVSHSFKIGKGETQFPFEFTNFCAVGVSDIAVYGDTVYSLEESKLHILSLNGKFGRYIPITYGKDEGGVAVAVISSDTVAIVIGYVWKRSASVLLISTKTGNVLKRIDYHRFLGSTDDRIVIESDRGTAYIRGKLHIPVTNVDNILTHEPPEAYLIVDISSGECYLQRQSDFFGRGSSTVTSFCDNVQVFTLYARHAYQVNINGSDNELLFEYGRHSEAPFNGIIDIPPKLDCETNTLWYWYCENDSTLVITGQSLFSK